MYILSVSLETQTCTNYQGGEYHQFIVKEHIIVKENAPFEQSHHAHVACSRGVIRSCHRSNAKLLEKQAGQAKRLVPEFDILIKKDTNGAVGRTRQISVICCLYHISLIVSVH